MLTIAYWLCCIDLPFEIFGGPSWLTTTRLALIIVCFLTIKLNFSKTHLSLQVEPQKQWTLNIRFVSVLVLISFVFLFEVLLIHMLRAKSIEPFYLSTALRIFLLPLLFFMFNSIIVSMRIDFLKAVSIGVILSILTGILFIIYVVQVNGIEALDNAKQFRSTFNQAAIDSEMYGEPIIALNRKLFGYLIMQPFALWMILKKKHFFLPKLKSHQIYCSWISLALAGYVGFMSGSRQFLLSFLFCLFIVFMIKGFRKPKLGLAWIVTLIISGFLLQDRIGLLFQEFFIERMQDSFQSNMFRYELALRAWRFFEESPLIGNGPKVFEILTSGYQAHNGFLQILVDWGILGAVTLIFTIYFLHFRSWYWAWRLRRKTSSNLLGFVIIGLVMAFILPWALAFFLEYSFWSFLALTTSLCTVAIRSKDSG